MKTTEGLICKSAMVQEQTKRELAILRSKKWKRPDEGQRDAPRRTISGAVTDVTSVGSYAIVKESSRSIKIVNRPL